MWHGPPARREARATEPRPIISSVRDHYKTARVACVDPAFGEAARGVARYAGQAGVPLVSSDARPDFELTARAAAMVVSPELPRGR